MVDSVERALFMQPEDPVVEGLRAVLEQMEAVLARQGVTADRRGRASAFDPERHEAIGVRPTDEVPDRTVVEVARSGSRSATGCCARRRWSSRARPRPVSD